MRAHTVRLRASYLLMPMYPLVHCVYRMYRMPSLRGGKLPLKIYWHSPRRASMQTDESQTSKQNTPDEAAVNGVAADPRYSRSTIGFPYTPLKDAELIAKQLHDEYGGKASPEQLAASLSASAKSGAFRIKIATARSFGALPVSRESLNLTPLGRRLT